MENVTHGSLFSGIGGFDLAASRMGWENIFQVEIDPFCQRVLQKNFPDAQRFSDIKDFDGSEFAGAIDIISGGFPCQPFSVAGQRRGKNDDRAIWHEMLRVVREIRPSWVVGENVTGIISMELDAVLSDLEGIGYACQTFVIPACAVNALHRRDRVWIVANRKSEQQKRGRHSRERRYGHPNKNSSYGGAFANSDRERELQPKGGVFDIGGRAEYGDSRASTNTYRRRRREGVQLAETQEGAANAFSRVYGHFCESGMWQPNDTSELLRTAYGIPGRVDGRGARIKALGNAIVPHVAYQIFNAINSIEWRT